MEYINGLRKYVGHQPLLMVGAAILVLNEQNQLLMMRRSESGSWGVPGGAMELGETLEETAKRELFEETNLKVGEMELFGVFSGPELYHRYPGGDEVFNVSIVYITYNVHGNINMADGEHFDFRYFSLSNLPREISPPVRPILRKLIETTS